MDLHSKCDVEKIVVEVTEDCNNACLHCYNYWWEDRRRVGSRQELSRSRILDLVRKVKRDAPLRHVALSGGEPFLRRDLPAIVKDLADEGLNSTIITNGVLLSESRLKQFSENCYFEVTLFSADSKLHNRMAGRNVFNRVLEGVVRLEKFEQKLILAYVLTKQNAHDVTRTIELGLALGAEAVLFNRVNLSRRVFSIADQLVPPVTMLRESLEAANETAEKYGIMIAISVPIPPCLVNIKDYPNLHFGWCPRGDKNAYYTIGPTGLLRPCNHSSVNLGDMRKQDFSEIVLSKKTSDFWASVPRECLECEHPLKAQCRGGCPAAADECYGTRNRIDPFVEIAQNASLHQ